MDLKHQHRVRPIKILTIDGGGVRGVIPASIILYMESILRRRVQNNNARLADYFDVIGGTSTGAILAGLYLLPSEASVSDLLRNQYLKYKHSAEQVLDFYMTQPQNIFVQTWGDYCWSVGGWRRSLYSASAIEEVLSKHAGNVRLEDMNNRFMALAYNTDLGEPHLFVSPGPGDVNREGNFYLRDVLRASSAAPTYFPIANFTRIGDTKPLHFIDGGMVANNPSSAIVSRVQETDPSGAPIMLVSISCGRLRDICPYVKAANWGKIEWADPSLSILIDANARETDMSMRERLRERGHYFRFDTPLVKASLNMDDKSPVNLENLRRDAVEYMQGEDVMLMLNQVVELLLQYSGPQVGAPEGQ